MRTALTTILLCLVLTGCQKDVALSLGNSNQDKIIALQPIGNYDQQQLYALRYQLGQFFQSRVFILDAVDLPRSFQSGHEERYSADSIIKFLLQFKNDSVVQVVGVTHKEIYTTSDEEIHDSDKVRINGNERRIRGLAYISDNACIVSDYSFQSDNEFLWTRRLWKAVLHEIGHNLGLAHCKNEDCTMSEKNGNIVSLKMFGGDFCSQCRQKVR